MSLASLLQALGAGSASRWGVTIQPPFEVIKFLLGLHIFILVIILSSPILQIHRWWWRPPRCSLGHVFCNVLLKYFIVYQGLCTKTKLAFVCTNRSKKIYSLFWACNPLLILLLTQADSVLQRGVQSQQHIMERSVLAGKLARIQGYSKLTFVILKQLTHKWMI